MNQRSDRRTEGFYYGPLTAIVSRIATMVCLCPSVISIPVFTDEFMLSRTRIVRRRGSSFCGTPLSTCGLTFHISIEGGKRILVSDE